MALLYCVLHFFVLLWVYIRTTVTRCLFSNNTLCDIYLDDDRTVGMNVHSVRCVHSDFTSHDRTLQFLFDEEQVICPEEEFTVIDYTYVLVGETSQPFKDYTYVFKYKNGLETHGVDELAMTPPEVKFEHVTVTWSRCWTFDLTEAFNRMRGPLSEFHTSLATFTHFPRLLEFLLYESDPDRWRLMQPMTALSDFKLDFAIAARRRQWRRVSSNGCERSGCLYTLNLFRLTDFSFELVLAALNDQRPQPITEEFH